ncbi:MAG: T9SS type A sorting domain-containing protein [Bacteroidia bacterium]|nr:T9SS type A sorting domain-containing protein [Bacteroidia bacterium]
MKSYSDFSKISAIIIIAGSFLLTKAFAQTGWQIYPYSPPGSVLTFPDDDGKHTDLSTTTEWWYLNMHLIGSAPLFKKYDVMLCYFSKPATMRIFNIADPVSGTFHTDVNQTPFVFSQQAGHWELTYNIPFLISDYSNWTYPSDNKTYSYFFHAEEPDNDDELDITLTGNRPPLVVGGDGFISLGDQGDSSFYYTYSNMKVEGSIKFNGVSDNISSGIGWIDRQWGPFTVGINSDNMYEWFSIQVDNPGATLGIPQMPSEFNIWPIFSDSNTVLYKPEWRLVSAIYSDTTQDTSSTFIFERTGYWYDQINNKYYSQDWRFINPLHGINIDITAAIENQVVDVTLFKFWEGSTEIKGTVKNLPVQGLGFAELVAGHDFEIIPPSAPHSLIITPYPHSYLLSWSASTQGTYPIGGYRIYRASNNDGYWQYIASTSALSYPDYSALPGSTYYYTITSFDNQTATSGSDYAIPVLAEPTGIKELTTESINLQVCPNPFNSNTTIRFILQQKERVTLSVVNIVGQSDIVIYNNVQLEAGTHSVSFNASNLQTGVYHLNLLTEKCIQQYKIIICQLD